MVYLFISIPLILIGLILAFILLNDLPQKGSLKLPKTTILIVLTCIVIGFGFHFFLLGLGI